jgi:Uncharacterized conserved protein (DUF2303).
MCDEKTPETATENQDEMLPGLKVEDVGPAMFAPLAGEGLRGDAISRLAKLGAKAKGIRTEYLFVPECINDVGLPPVIPVAIRTGDFPEVVSVKALVEEYRDRPARKKGRANVLTLQSFIALVNRHATDHSVIFANTDWRSPEFTAIIDYHCKNRMVPETLENGEPTGNEIFVEGLPDNGKHHIHYTFPLSEEWKTWMAGNGKPMDQADFAIFLEDRIAELASPTDFEKSNLERDFATTVAPPSQIVQLSRGLKIHVESKGAHTVNLASGEGQISWEETHKDADGKALKVPGIFMVSVAPFHRGETVRMPVRLRYRAKDGKILWFYQLYRPDLHITERVLGDLAIVGEETKLPTYEGNPETYY